MRAAVLLMLLLAGGAAAQGPTLADRRRSLVEAKRDAALAGARADRLLAAAAAARTAAERAAAEEQGLAARVIASVAELEAAEARVAIVARLLAEQRARLAQAQAPVAKLLAGLQALATRPAIVAAAQPGSVEDLVRLRAVLGGTLPVVRARTAAVRAALAETRRLANASTLAARGLRDGRAKLERDRTALALAGARERRRAQGLGRDAMTESDRALALGERARDLVDQLELGEAENATAAELAALPGPVMRPFGSDARRAARAARAYRLPVAGRLLTGFGEMSDAGVHSRGLTFAVAPDARVLAPAGGTVRYARAFRGYGGIVIVDHGAGWTSLVTGLGRIGVSPGAVVRQGGVLGSAAAGEEPAVTVELRRRGRPVDVAALL